MKVLFVINAPIVGGAERHTFDLGAQLADFGWQVSVFAIRQGPVPPPSSVRLDQPMRRTRFFRRLREFTSTLSSAQPDLLVSVNERPIAMTSLGRWLARWRPPVSAIMHTTVINTTRQRTLQQIYNPLFSHADSVTFVSRLQREYWSRNGLAPRTSQVILNGIDLERFRPDLARQHRQAARRRFAFDDQDFVLGHTAVMRPEKNHLQLLDVVATLRRDRWPVKALLVGDGVMRSRIERRIAALGLKGAVLITGMVDDVLPYVAAYDLGVNCSLAIETLSMSALEIMATGVPMVMSDLGGAAEIVDGANGRLFPIGDAGAMAAAILSFREAAVRDAAGAAARRTAEGKFDRRRMAREYHAHFQSLVGARQAAESLAVG